MTYKLAEIDEVWRPTSTYDALSKDWVTLSPDSAFYELIAPNKSSELLDLRPSILEQGHHGPGIRETMMRSSRLFEGNESII